MKERNLMRAGLAAVGLLCATVCAAPSWHQKLYLGNGGLWRQRLQVTIHNDTNRAAEGEPVDLPIGAGPGQANLVGAEAGAVRVCDAEGVEMLYSITDRGGNRVERGRIPAGATLTIPVECPAHEAAVYFVYFDNPRAWPVPDFLAGVESLRNGGLEKGTGGTPAGWQHDVNDAQHRTFWVGENPHSGKKCLKTVVSEGAEPTWIATRQKGIHLLGGAHYVMTAWVKAQDVKGNAGWYIHVGNAGNPMLSSPMLYGGGGTYDWKQVRAEFDTPPEANVADLGTVLRGTGTAWFDDVRLQCNDRPRLRASVGRPERLQLRVVGQDAPWAPDEPGATVHRTYRVPIRVVNTDDGQAVSGMLSVDVSTALARLRGKVDRKSLRLVDAGKTVPLYQLRDVLLFEGTVPPRTAKTFYLYCATAKAAPPSGKPTQFAENPALPGAEVTNPEENVFRGDYEALLDSTRNLVKNGSFEEGANLPANWSSGTEGQRPGGVVMGLDRPGLFGGRCVKMSIPATSKPAWTGWRQDVPVQPEKTYLYAAWLRTEEVSPNVQIHAHYRNAKGELCATRKYTGAGPQLSGTHGWTMLSGLFTMPRDVATFQLHLTMHGTGTVWHDGVVLVEVTAGHVLPLESRSPGTTDRLTVWPVNAVVKVFREDLPPERIPAARVTCARNEKEPLQLVVRGPRPLARVKISVARPVGPGGTHLPPPDVGVVGYVPIDHKTNYYSTTSPTWYRKYPAGPGACDGWPGWWPDPLLPRDTFDLAADTTQPFWLTFRVPKGAAAGDYRGQVRLTHNGKTLVTTPFTVHVWNFTLPDDTHLKAIYDCRQGPQWTLPGTTREEQLRKMWAFMARHRVCPDSIRVGPGIQYKNGKVIADFTEFDAAAEYYFNQLHLPHSYTPWMFYGFGWGHLPKKAFGQQPYEGNYPYEGVDRSKLRPEYKKAYQACLKVFWDHLKAKGWVDKFVLYLSDEPYDRDPKIRAQMKALCKMIHQVDPAIPIYSSTWHHQPEWDGYLTVWGFGHYGIVPAAEIRALQRDGATIWWTTDGQMCTDTPYCAIERLLPHYCFKYGAKAYEFWGIDWLTYNPYQFGWHRYNLHNFGPGRPQTWVRYPNGDGFLAYPGGPIGHDGPVSSLRLEQAREGVEDYEYLYLLRSRLQGAKQTRKAAAAAERALAQAQSLVSMPCAIGRYSTKILPDPDAVFRVKETLAQAIERLTPASQ